MARTATIVASSNFMVDGGCDRSIIGQGGMMNDERRLFDICHVFHSCSVVMVLFLKKYFFLKREIHHITYAHCHVCDATHLGQKGDIKGVPQNDYLV